MRQGPGPSCTKGPVHQASEPTRHKHECGDDMIFNHNGPPSKVAPCKDTTLQTIFTGPTEAEVEKCKYPHTQVVEVTVSKRDAKNKPVVGKVITTVASKSTECDWTVGTKT